MSRTTRIAGSFAIVVIVYWAYALLAVPWIEPSDSSRGNQEITDDDRAKGTQYANMRLRQLDGLFPPGAWELKNPKILESDRAKVLFQDYRNFPDGRVELHPCTIIFASDALGDEAQRRRQSIILEVPAGAKLQFDQPLDLNRGKIGRLVRGQLDKEVKIRSQWKEPGPEDDLLIVTHDVQLTEQTITTPNPVEFRWGPHFGRGSDMVIKLLAGPPPPGMGGAGPNVAGVESFELRHVERLHLDLGQTMAPPEKGTDPIGAQHPEGRSDQWGRSPFPEAEQPSNVPVEIHCRGPFRFDVVGRVATFRDRVDVMKANPGKPADQLACDLLSLYFAQPSKQEGKPAPAAGSFGLVAERIEAQGNPVVVTAPSQNVVSRAPWLQYHLLANSITLAGGQDAFLRQGDNEIHARSLCYQSAGPGRLGRVTAQGPGWLRGHSPDRPEQQLTAHWKDQLRVAPDQQCQRIVLTGGAELNFHGAGQLQAKQIDFWLRESSPSAKGQQLRPDLLWARNDVHMNAPQLSAKADDLQVWFAEGASAQRTGAGGQQRPAAAVPGMTAVPGMNGNDRGMSGPPPISLPGQAAPGAAAVPSPPVQSAPQRFEVAGRLLRVRVLLDQQQTAVSHLVVENDVRLLETQTSPPGQRPLVICGDRLEAIDVSAPDAVVTVAGRPARFEARGLALSGANIKLNRGANRLWIDGAGQMNVTDVSPGGGFQPQGGAPAAVGTLTVDWRGRMQFDGHTAQFEDSVVAVAGPRQLQTQTMKVRLQRPVSFSQPNAEEQPQVEEIQCYGGVSMEERIFDQQQQPTSHDRMELSDLVINLLNGMVKGGPGWLNSVHRGSDNPWMLSGAAGGRAPAPAAAAAAQNQLNCLHVRFLRSITGNLLHHQLTFADQVQMVYAPVNDWNAMLATTNVDQLGPQAVALLCDQLSVVEMPLPAGSQRSLELDAQGNVRVDGSTFTATGNRITYDEAKDWLILKGDGRNDARLFQQPEAGAERSEVAAQEIHYWPKSKRLNVVGAQSLQLGQPPGKDTRR